MAVDGTTLEDNGEGLAQGVAVVEGSDSGNI